MMKEEVRKIRIEEELASKTQQVEELRSKLLRIQQDFNFNIHLIEERDTEIEDLEGKVYTLRQRLQEKELELSELKATHASIQENLKAELAEATQSEHSLSTARDDLQTQLSQLKRIHQTEIETLHSQFHSQLSRTEQTLKEEIFQLQVGRESAQEQFETLLNQKEEALAITNSRLHSTNAQYSQEIAKLNTKLRETQTALQGKYSEKQVEALKQAYQLDMENYQRDLDDKESIIRRLKAQIQSLAEYEVETAPPQEFQRLLHEQEEELKYLQQTHQMQVDRLHRNYQTQIDRLRDKVEEAEEEAREAANHIKKIREQMLQQDKVKSIQHTQSDEQWETQVQALKKQLIEVQNQPRFDKEKAELERKVQELEKAFAEQEILYKRELDRMRAQLVQKPALSEDFPEPSSVKSYRSVHPLEEENLELKGIIAKMAEDMKKVQTLAPKPSPQNELELERMRQLCSKLKQEVSRLTQERDQLLTISSELRAQLNCTENYQPDWPQKSQDQRIDDPQEEEQFHEETKVPETFDFEEPQREIEDSHRPEPFYKLPPSNTHRETPSQREIAERMRQAKVKKPQRPLVRNYNVRS